MTVCAIPYELSADRRAGAAHYANALFFKPGRGKTQPFRGTGSREPRPGTLDLLLQNVAGICRRDQCVGIHRQQKLLRHGIGGGLAYSRDVTRVIAVTLFK